MTEQERVDKLKARMSRWQAYVDKPQTNASQQTSVVQELPTEISQALIVHTAERSNEGFRSASACEPPQHTGRDAAFEPDPLFVLQEAQIADLKSAIAREREQVDRLADEVRRAQTLHAVTLYSQLTEEKGGEVEHQPAQRQIPEAAPPYYDAHRMNLARILGLLLVLTSVLTLVFFITR